MPAFVLILCSLTLACATASESPRAVPHDNAALDYWSAFALMPEESRFDSSVDRYFDNKEPANLAWSKAAALFALRAAERTGCDWGGRAAIDGPELLLPYITPARQFGRYMAFQMWQTPEHAADAFVSGVALGRHLQRSETLIEQLVGLAIEDTMLEAAGRSLGTWTKETRLQIHARLEALPARSGPDHWFDGEREGWGPWMKREVEAKGLIGFFREYGGLLTVGQQSGILSDAITPALAAVRIGGEEGLDAKIKELDGWYDRLETIAALPLAEREQALADFDSDVTEATNPLVPLLLPAVGPIINRYERVDLTAALISALLAAPEGSQAAATATALPRIVTASSASLLGGERLTMTTTLGGEELVLNLAPRQLKARQQREKPVGAEDF